jgi:hypothetical protein
MNTVPKNKQEAQLLFKNGLITGEQYINADFDSSDDDSSDDETYLDKNTKIKISKSVKKQMIKDIELLMSK